MGGEKKIKKKGENKKRKLKLKREIMQKGQQ